MKPKAFSALFPAKIGFIEPMYARLVQSLPQGQEWFYEVKFDGYRCLAGRDSTVVTLWSRRGNLFTNQFPQITQACKRLSPGTLVDGEVVALDESGRVSFNLLQHRRSKAQALLFYAFDVLVCRGRSLMQQPLERRRETLTEIFKRVKVHGIVVPKRQTKIPVKAINGRCFKCGYRLAWILILGKRFSSHKSFMKQH